MNVRMPKEDDQGYTTEKVEQNVLTNEEGNPYVVFKDSSGVHIVSISKTPFDSDIYDYYSDKPSEEDQVVAYAEYGNREERLEEVIIQQVDEKFNFVEGTEKHFKCDTLLLSVGLIPENELSKSANIELSNITSGAIVDQNRETNIKGIFAWGNVLHVHDLVDFVSEEAEIAGISAANYIKDIEEEKTKITIKTDGKIRYTVPQKITKLEDAEVYFRVSNIFNNVKVCVYADDKLIKSVNKIKVAPGEMEKVKLSCEDLKDVKKICFKLEEKWKEI